LPNVSLFDLTGFKFTNPDQNIVGNLEEAFGVFWRNADACAMKIRSFLEALMDDNNVPKTYTDGKGKLRDSKLYRRIEDFEKKFPNHNLKEVLHNLRDFTNLGSHSGANVPREKLVLMIEMAELILHQLYEDDRKKLDRLNSELKN
jgi:hypothetical protein